MPQVAYPDVSRVVALLTRGDEEIVNVFHVRQGALHIPASTLDRFDRFYTNGGADPVGSRGLLDRIANDIIVDSISIQDLSTVPYPAPTVRVKGTVGTQASPVLPLGTALVVTLRTATAGRRFRGRTYLAGFTELDNDESGGYPRPSVALQAAVANAYEDLGDGIATDGDRLAVLSRAEGDETAVTSIQVKDKWASQRRRQASIPATVVTTRNV